MYRLELKIYFPSKFLLFFSIRHHRKPPEYSFPVTAKVIPINAVAHVVYFRGEGEGYGVYRAASNWFDEVSLTQSWTHYPVSVYRNVHMYCMEVCVVCSNGKGKSDKWLVGSCRPCQCTM